MIICKCKLILESACIPGEFDSYPVDMEKDVELPFVPVQKICIDGLTYQRCEYSTSTGLFTLVAQECQLRTIPEGFTRTYDWE